MGEGATRSGAGHLMRGVTERGDAERGSLADRRWGAGRGTCWQTQMRSKIGLPLIQFDGLGIELRPELRAELPDRGEAATGWKAAREATSCWP